MKQQRFETSYEADWQQLEALLKALEARHYRYGQRESAQLPRLYRKVCHHLSLAQARGYSHQLVARLNNLVLRGHQQLYQRRTHFLRSLLRFVVVEFPATVRRHRGYVGMASALFYLPALILFGLVSTWPELVYSVFHPMQVADFEAMYDPGAEHIGRNRAAADDMQMFGFYIQNNIGVGFQTFASGILLGLGSLFYLVYNGLILGALAAHLTELRYVDTFFPFIIGHCAFEVTAITIAGGAGLMLGHALLRPGQQRRFHALQRAAGEALPLVYGVIVMLVIAAFIEAFWSSISSIAPALKYAVGAVLWLMVGTYFLLAGRVRGAG